LQHLGVNAQTLSLDAMVASARTDERIAISPEISMTALAENVDLHDRIQESVVELPMSERVVAHRFLAEQAPTIAASMGGDLSVSVEYCLVRIDRPWLLRPFLDQPGWYVPGQRAGFAGSQLPIGVLALRNLEISGPWSDEDVAASAVASDFGPFRVAGGIVDGTLRAPGLQVAGWLFERLGTLPPVDAPGTTPPAPPPPREYVVVKGDSLWKIAAAFYGDGKRWPELATANQLADPNKIAVGQKLVIP
jgi:nucleoid-associated protein YgaU